MEFQSRWATEDGITALQMDIKVGGITSADHALKALSPGATRTIAHPRKDERGDYPNLARKSRSFAPRIYTCKIPVDKIRDVIGPGGKMIRSSSSKLASD